MPVSVFIDGDAGTIGLRIRELLEPRDDLALLSLPEETRKDPGARREMLNACDVAILCLPDEASRESVSLIDNPHVRVIDGSTAFRTSPGWVYGLPELSPEQRSAIRDASRVSNPGCWPTCVNLLTHPLVTAGLLPRDAALTIHGLSGYSGAGKAAIKKWESAESGLFNHPFEAPYALTVAHKHIPEMQRYGLLDVEPQFVPAVGPFVTGMRVQIPLHAAQLRGVTAEVVRETYLAAYRNEQFIHVAAESEYTPANEFTFDPRACNDTNNVLIRAIQHPSGHVLLMAVLDNLGKGASGAAVQSLNIMLGLDEAHGLS